mmetsp:Transcript_26772/g.50351  ORF Transcript_26772/g.50351 Transcript_26772/m.50351 type:complete len:257 (+) Transcript_26772:903-1673(+)
MAPSASIAAHRGRSSDGGGRCDAVAMGGGATSSRSDTIGANKSADGLAKGPIAAKAEAAAARLAASGDFSRPSSLLIASPSLPTTSARPPTARVAAKRVVRSESLRASRTRGSTDAGALLPRWAMATRAECRSRGSPSISESFRPRNSSSKQLSASAVRAASCAKASTATPCTSGTFSVESRSAMGRAWRVALRAASVRRAVQRTATLRSRQAETCRITSGFRAGGTKGPTFPNARSPAVTATSSGRMRSANRASS